MKKTQSSKSQSAVAQSLSPIAQRLGPIEDRPIGALAAYANNPRKHPEKQLVKLAASIREFGFAIPILVDSDNVIIAGEARLHAALRLGLEHVPVIVAHHWTPAQVRAFRLADNRLAELAVWDQSTLSIELAAIIELDATPIEILGWETAEIDLIIDDQNQTSSSPDPADAHVEPPALATTRQGDLWLLDRHHRLLCGSSLEPLVWSRLMGNEQAAMAFTDPPYNVPVNGHICGLGKTHHAEFAMASGEMTPAAFIAFLSRALDAMQAHLKDGAILNVCMDWRHIAELMAALEANKLALINLCIWNKTNGGMGSLYRSKHELVFIAKKGTAAHTNTVALGKHGRYRTNVWDYAGVNTFGRTRMQDLADHPTVKPVALVADAIRDVSMPGEIVVDGFIGSGATILAAERTKRRAFGVEIDPRYVDVAIQRWQTMTGLKAVLEATGQTHAEVTCERRGQEIPEADRPADPGRLGSTER